MRKTVGILLVIFALSVAFALFIPDQRNVAPIIEGQEEEATVSEREIQAFNHIEYSLLSNGRYLAVLDPGGFEGERHGGALTIFDTLNGAIVERIDNVAGFAPLSLDGGAFLFSARTGIEFGVFAYNLDTGLSADLGISGGKGGIILFDGELYMSSNPVSYNYINAGGDNYFGASDWAIVHYASSEIVDAVDGLDFGLEEVYPRIAVLSEEESEILSENNISLLSRGGKFFLVVNQ